MQTADLSAYSIRLFRTDEVDAYKSMRLEALELEFGTFGNSHLTEAGFPENYWQERINNPSIGCFGLYHNDHIIGITAIVIDPENMLEAYMTQSYIRKEYRGLGLSNLLYESRFSWAFAKQLKRLTIGHKRTNRASAIAIQRNGFVFTHSLSRNWPDGSVEDMMYYERLL